jgi:hypothetical protein
MQGSNGFDFQSECAIDFSCETRNYTPSRSDNLRWYVFATVLPFLCQNKPGRTL